MVRDCRLRQTYRLFNFACAKARKFFFRAHVSGSCAALSERLQNAAPCGIDNCVKSNIHSSALNVHRLCRGNPQNWRWPIRNDEAEPDPDLLTS